MNDIFLSFYSVFPQASGSSMNFNTRESCGYCPTKLHGRIGRVKFVVFKKNKLQLRLQLQFLLQIAWQISCNCILNIHDKLLIS